MPESCPVATLGPLKAGVWVRTRIVPAPDFGLKATHRLARASLQVGGRGFESDCLLHRRSDKENLAGWRNQDLTRTVDELGRG